MNLGGGGPDRDNSGLPPVDVEIPDDARELDRDVQAYHRELKAERRRRRSRRLRLTLSRDGLAMPLLVCCLVFALIAGTLLTFFTSTSIDQPGLPGGPAAGSGGRTPAPPNLAGVPVQVAGQMRAIDTLGPSILLVAPAHCAATCDATMTHLASLAAAAHESVYLVSPPTALPTATRLAAQIGYGVRPATDVYGELDGRGYPHAGVTAILVTPTGAVSYDQQLPDNAVTLQGLIDSVLAHRLRRGAG